MSSDRLNASLSSSDTTTGALTLVEARFVPQRYEPNYPYPLLVLLHTKGGDEEQMVRSMPALSWRNYVGLSLRGPEPCIRRGQPSGYSWGSAFARPDRQGPRRASSLSDAEILRRRLHDASPDPIDQLEDGIFAAIRQTRRALHVHSERIFLVG